MNQLIRTTEQGNNVISYQTMSGLTLTRISSRPMNIVVLSNGNNLIAFETEEQFKDWTKYFGIDFVILTK